MVLGDGICSDLYNTPDCNFDGGDCCSPNSIMTFCNLCQCFNETNYITPPTTVEWVGNSKSILKLSVHNILKILLALLSMNMVQNAMILGLLEMVFVMIITILWLAIMMVEIVVLESKE